MKFFYFLAISLAIAFGFGTGVANAGPGAGAPTITVSELKAALDGGDNVVVIDVRAIGDYPTGDIKIKGALSIPINVLEERLDEIPFGASIITYCS